MSQGVFLKSCRNLILKSISLRRTYQYRREGVPFRQAEYFHHLLKFEDALTSFGLTSFLMDGTLFGAIRQGAFAGRPADLDLAIKVDQNFDLVGFNSYLKTNRFVVAPGYETLRHRQRYQYKYRFLFGILKLHAGSISLVFFSNDEKGNWINLMEEISHKAESPHGSIRRVDSIAEKNLENLRTAKIFGREFKVPLNAEDLIAAQYGDDWMIPKSRQYAWIPPNIISE